MAIVPADLQKIARVCPLKQQRQAGKATPHIGMARRQPNSHASRDRDHRNVSSPRIIRSKSATPTLRSTIRRRPFAVTTSRVPVAAGAARSVVDWTSTQSGPAQIHLPDSRQAVLRARSCATKTEAVSKADDAVLSPTPAADPDSFPRQSATSRQPTSADADQSPRFQGDAIGDYQ